MTQEGVTCRHHIVPLRPFGAPCASLVLTSATPVGVGGCPWLWWPNARSRRARLSSGSRRGTRASASGSMLAFSRRSACWKVSETSPTSATIPQDRCWRVRHCPNVSTSRRPPQDRGMADFEVHLALDGEVLLVGLARSNRVRGGDRMMARSKSIQAEAVLRVTSPAHKP